VQSAGQLKKYGHYSTKDISTLLRMNKLIFVATLSTLTVFGISQDPGSGPATTASEQSMDTTSEAKTARKLAREWLSSKSWVRGENSDGAFVAIGTAPFSGKSSNSSLARSNAYQLAALKAKNELAEFISKQISTSVAASLKEGTVPQDANGLKKDVIQNLVEAVRSKAGDGANVASANNVLNSSEFASAVRTVARAEVCGTSISNSFETITPAGDGAFAVVVRFTATSRQMAAAAMGKAEAPKNENLAEAYSWAKEQTESQLAQTYGAKLFRTATNEVCVLAFGQADVNGSSENAFDIAAEKAKTAADGEIRQFVGEFVDSEAILSRRSSIKEMAQSGSEYQDVEGYQKNLQAKAKGLQFQGIKPIREWEAKPAGAKPVAGVVMMWSVSGADSANALRKQMEQVGGSQGGTGRRDAAPSASPADGRNLPGIKRGSTGNAVPEP